MMYSPSLSPWITQALRIDEDRQRFEDAQKRLQTRDTRKLDVREADYQATISKYAEIERNTRERRGGELHAAEKAYLEQRRSDAERSYFGAEGMRAIEMRFAEQDRRAAEARQRDEQRVAQRSEPAVRPADRREERLVTSDERCMRPEVQANEQKEDRKLAREAEAPGEAWRLDPRLQTEKGDPKENFNFRQHAAYRDMRREASAIAQRRDFVSQLRSDAEDHRANGRELLADRYDAQAQFEESSFASRDAHPDLRDGHAKAAQQAAQDIRRLNREAGYPEGLDQRDDPQKQEDKEKQATMRATESAPRAREAQPDVARHASHHQQQMDSIREGMRRQDSQRRQQQAEELHKPQR